MYHLKDERSKAKDDRTREPVDIPESLLSTETLRQARAMPWKAGNEIRRLLILPSRSLAAAGHRDRGGLASLWAANHSAPPPKPHLHRARRKSEVDPRSNPLGPNHPVILSTRRPARS